MTVIGVDIGNTGAIALLTEDGALLAVHDLPTLADGPKNRPAINAPLLAAIIARAGEVRIAFVEWVGPRPTDGVVQAFAFGRAKGVIEGVLAAVGVPVAFLTPPQWKRLHSIPPGRDQKDLARSRAIARWPAKAALFSRKCDDGRAEACLIGLAGMLREGSVKERLMKEIEHA